HPPPSGGGRTREADFHGQKRSNETHASTTDPEARLYRKGPGKEAKLCLMGRMREKAMRSRAKEPPNCSTTGRSRSNSPTETATKPSSKQNETLLQQPARGRFRAAHCLLSFDSAHGGTGGLRFG